MSGAWEKKKALFLADILVLDLADERGSFCAKLLADLGATVVKVERPPGKGEPAKRSGSLSFTYRNANKECLVLDLDDRRDRRSLRNLVRKADVLLETFPPPYLPRRHLSYGHLKRISPGLVHLSITGFGLTGRRRGYGWNDTVISAYSGQMYVSGMRGAPPVKVPGGQSYYSAALFGAVAILLALRERTQTGRGRLIDLSAQEALASTLDHVMVDYFSDRRVTTRQANIYGEKAFAILPCADGFIQITILRNWETLLELMSAEGAAEDLTEHEWQQETYREAHFDRIAEVAGRWTALHTKDDLFALGQALRFPWAPVYAPEEVLRSPQLAERRYFGTAGSGKGGYLLPGPPYRFNASRSVSSGRAPLVAPGVPLLHGIRVLDFTWMLAGPFATRILADFGAEVIKVQSRRTAKGGENNGTAYFATWNRNKRSITLNMDRPEARDLILRLAAGSDVVMENFAPRIMANWGLTYSRLREAKPDLIMASISAMGQTGPWREYVGFGPTFHALSGLTHQMSRGLTTPVCLGHAYGDSVIGLYATLAVLTALGHRDATGEGQYIDLSGYEAVCSLLGPLLMETSGTESGTAGKVAPPREGAPALDGCFPCTGEDRWCVITASKEEEWRALCRVIGVADPAGRRIRTAEGRKEHRAHLEALIARWTRERTPEDVASVLQAAGVAAGVVQDARDLAGDAQLAERGYFVSLPHPTLGGTISDRTPLAFGRREAGRWRAAPLLGADNHPVFSDLLGMSDDEIRLYVEKGIIG
jgi:crotonobetainyl-CoA:carnitine CoA-transferase CaiB-like acyl-CoA transferase